MLSRSKDNKNFDKQKHNTDLNEKSAQRDANTARAGCSKVRTPPATYTHKHTERDKTDYNTQRR